MCERLVGLGHLVRILTLFDRVAGSVAGVHDLAREALGHRALVAVSGIAGQPAQSQRLAALRSYLHRNLVSGTADAACLDLQLGHDVFHCLLKGLQRIVAALVLDDVKRAVDDFLGNTLLAVIHDAVDQAGHHLRVIKRIGQNVALRDIASSWHIFFPPSLS